MLVVRADVVDLKAEGRGGELEHSRAQIVPVQAAGASVFPSAFSKARLPMVPSTIASTRPLRFLPSLRGAQSGGALAAWENVVGPGEGPPLHVHKNEDEIWYALEGSFRFTLGGYMSAAQPGAFVYIPRGVVHTWQNIGQTPGRFLVVMAPAGFETFFDKFAELQSDAPPIDAFGRLGPGVGLTVVGPPLGESHPLSRSGR